MKRQESIWMISRQLSMWLVILSALLLIDIYAWATDENKWAFCVGDVAFDIPQNMRVTSAEGVNNAEGAVEQLASIREMDHSSFKADIYHGLANVSPFTPPENMPSTKIALGKIVASMSCVTDQHGLKSCHIAYDIADNSDKIMVFSYSDLSWDESIIVDNIWISAHLDEGCKTKQ
jgi:hypothetical protein